MTGGCRKSKQRLTRVDNAKEHRSRTQGAGPATGAEAEHPRKGRTGGAQPPG